MLPVAKMSLGQMQQNQPIRRGGGIAPGFDRDRCLALVISQVCPNLPLCSSFSDTITGVAPGAERCNISCNWNEEIGWVTAPKRFCLVFQHFDWENCVSPGQTIFLTNIQ